jgi:hypothetical protein
MSVFDGGGYIGYNSTYTYTSIVTSGLVLNLDASNASSYPGTGTAWTDLSGNGNNGTLINGPTYSSTNDGSIVFDGIDDRVDMLTSLGTLSNYTINFWAKRAAEYKMPFSTADGIFYWFGDASWRYVHSGGAGEYYYAKPTSIPLDTWGYYAVVYDGSKVVIYRQGIYQGQQATTGTANFTSGLRIGWFPNATYLFLGNIANFSVYNRALTAAEITQNFNTLRGRFGV